MPEVAASMQSGSAAVKAESTRTRYQRGRAVPSGRYDMKKSLSELEASAEARSLGRRAGAGPRGDWVSTAGRVSMEARDGKGLLSMVSMSTAG
jgi:hypothetical protein